MIIPESTLEEIRARVTVSSVVGERVKLVRKGREFSGLCPFHTEKSPSFFVNDDKRFYKCFGCGKSGDAFAFLTETKGLTFVEAVEELAARAGVEIPRRPVDRQQEERLSAAQAALVAAQAFFAQQLQTSDTARAYLSGRGVTPIDVARFGLGWAPDSRSALKAHLSAKGVPEAAAIEAGLLKRGDDGSVFDFFRGRVIFPICDRRGRPIGFGARSLTQQQPKYLNSPDGPLFHKGRTLYGLHLAREGAARKQPVLVAEGYLDVIALHRAGFTGAVAPLGTALTEEQLQELWRMNPEPILCLDGDAAGQRAAQRAAERALPLIGVGRTLRFLTLPPGQDPDDLIRAGGTLTLDAAMPMVDWLWLTSTRDCLIDTPEHRAALKQSLRDTVRLIQDAELRKLYGQEIARRLEDLLPAPRIALPPQPRRKPEQTGLSGAPAVRPDPGLAWLAATLRAYPDIAELHPEELATLDLDQAGPWRLGIPSSLHEAVTAVADFLTRLNRRAVEMQRREAARIFGQTGSVAEFQVWRQLGATQ